MSHKTNRASLLGLPAELRLRIYEYALQGVHLTLRNRTFDESLTERNAWALLHINRQIREEIHPLFYSTITFDLKDGFTLQKLQIWLATIGPEAVAKLRHLHFNCKTRCAMFGLQPDTDYCHREARLNLSLPRLWFRTSVQKPNAPVPVEFDAAGKPSAFSRQPLLSLCSNSAPSCRTRTHFAVKAAARWIEWKDGKPVVTERALVEIWTALTIDNCEGGDLM